MSLDMGRYVLGDHFGRTVAHEIRDSGVSGIDRSPQGSPGAFSV